MSRLRRLLGSNVLALVAQQSANVLASLGLQIYLARRLTQEQFGTIGFIAGVIGLVVFIGQLRMNILLTRQVARAPESVRLAMGLAWRATHLLALPMALVGLGWVALQDGRPETLVATGLALVGLYLSSLALVPEAALQGLRQMRPIGPAWLLSRLALVIATIAFVETATTVVSVYAAQVVGWMVLLGLMWRASRRHIGPAVAPQSTADVGAFLAATLPFAGIGFMAAVHVMSDIVILEWARGPEEVAVYRVAALAVTNLPMISFFVVRASYPRIAAKTNDLDAAADEVSFSVRWMLLLGMPMALGGMLVAEPLIVALVGERYAAAATIMWWLFPMVPLRFINNAVGSAMLAMDQQRARFHAIVFTAVLNVALNLVFIPRYGALAAAITTLLTEVVLNAWYGLSLHRVLPNVRYLRSFLTTLAPLAAMTAVVYATSSLHVGGRVLLGGLAYGVVLVVLGGLRRADLRRLVRL